MLTFGYENRFSGPLKALAAIAFGVFLIVTKANAMTLIVQIMSVGAFAYGVFSLVVSLKDKSMAMLTGNAVINIIASVLLFAFAGPVSAVVRYILGSLLFMFGLYQVVVLYSARNVINGGFLPMVLPVLIMLGGCMFFSQELIGTDIMGMLAGIAFILFGVSEILATYKMNQVLSKLKAEAEAAAEQMAVEENTAGPDGELQQIEDGSVKDVDFEKVDQ